MGYLEFEEEAENRLVLEDDIFSRVFGCLFFIALGALLVRYIIISYSPDVGWRYVPSLLIELVLILIGVALIGFGLKLIVISDSVIIDKKIQSVIIKRNSIIKSLEFIREIRFSDIRAIQIVRTTSTRESSEGSIYFDDSWSVYIATNKGESPCIYSANSRPDAERVAEDIRKLTDKGISEFHIS